MIVSKPSDRLIVALDFPEVAQARALVATLGDSVSFYKIGLELAYGGTSADNGFALADELAAKGKKIFLDLKLTTFPIRCSARRRRSRAGASIS